MLVTAIQAGVLAAAQEVEARGVLAGIGRKILVIVIVLVVLGVLLGFALARKFGRRR